MDELKNIVSKNMAILRRRVGFTQTQLAQRLNYSDKAVSKWERGEALPDILVFKQLADIYGVSIDFFFENHNENDKIKFKPNGKRITRNKLIITILSLLGIWFFATLAFVWAWTLGKTLWIIFVGAIPLSFIDIIVFNSIWGNPRHNLYYISLLIWSFLTFIYLLLLNRQLYLIFILGIPCQIATVLSFGFKLPRKKNNDE